MDFEFAKHLMMRPYEDLLRQLIAETKDDKPSAEWPVVRLTVGSQTYTGSPVKLDTLSSEAWVALVDADMHSGEEALTLLQVRTISGLVLLNPRQHLRAISEPGEWSVGESSAPSWLELERALGGVSKVLKTLPGLQVLLEGGTEDASPAIRSFAGQVVQALHTVLPKIASDSLGLKALKPIQKMILAFDPGSALEVESGKGQMRIVFGFKMNPKDVAKTLQTQIEKIL